MEVRLMLRRVLACLIMCLLNTCQENFFMHIIITEWVEKSYKATAEAFKITAGIIKRKSPWYVEWSLCFQENPQVIPVLFFQCVKAAELIGTFVSPKVSLRLITSAFGKTPKPSCIMVLTAVIRGSPKEILQPHLTDLGNTLSQAGVCQRSEEVRLTGKYTANQSFRLWCSQLIFSLVLLERSHSYPSLAHLSHPISGYSCGHVSETKQELRYPPWAMLWSPGQICCSPKLASSPLSQQMWAQVWELL